jgi:hypothetical protein
MQPSHFCVQEQVDAYMSICTVNYCVDVQMTSTTSSWAHKIEKKYVSSFGNLHHHQRQCFVTKLPNHMKYIPF